MVPIAYSLTDNKVGGEKAMETKKVYDYCVHKINGTLSDKTPLLELEEHLNLQGEDGFRLVCAIPQVYEGTTESTVLIFESEDEEMR